MPPRQRGRRHPGPPAPPPYVAAAPVAASGGGSKKGLLVGGGILAAIAVAVVAFLALGGDDKGSDGDLRAEWPPSSGRRATAASPRTRPSASPTTTS